MEYKTIAKTIIELKEADLKFRDELIQRGDLGKGYNKEMEQLHNKNAKLLNDIIDIIGYPTTEKVGEAASAAAWLIIQHSIGQPKFMKKCAKLLESAVSEHQANPIYLAYLTDRIAVFEGKLQLYGTSFDWDKNGELSPKPFDDLKKVNQRRKLLGLNTVEEQTQIISDQAKEENQTRPTDFKQREEDYDNWRRAVGWIK